MTTQHNVLRRLATGAVLLGLLSLAVAPVRPVQAVEPVMFDYLIGTGFLCSFGPDACPVISMAPNGDTVELTGSGSVMTHPKMATGSGTFIHRRPGGAIIGQGTWTAGALISLKSYGCGGEGLPSNFCGGKALIAVHLVADSGLETDGFLWVTCALGPRLPRSAMEGIKLVVPAVGGLFNREVSGFTLFMTP